uniref:Uncharacterized protein n=1 Tax=Xiphophorus couchianus TaxID=32473 RepID=A0A3B5LN84_9TELE
EPGLLSAARSQMGLPERLGTPPAERLAGQEASRFALTSVFKFQGHVETIFDCKFKPDDPNLLATASFDGTIKIWDTNTLTAVSTSPDSKRIATCSGDGFW